MNKIKLLSIVATVLFISNVALAAFMFFGKHRPPAHEGPRDIIIERLHFDKQQVGAYDKLINQHQNAMREKKDEMMELKNKLYSRLLDNSDDAVKDSLEREIGKLQITIENINYNNSFVINVFDLNAGIYFLRLKINNSVVVKKFVKE